MRIDVYKADDIGARSEQQDTAEFARLNDPADSELIVLADGVGGQTGGAVASRLAVDTFLEAAAAGVFDDEPGQRGSLLSIMHKANSRIRERVEANPGLEGMATTLVAAIISPGCVKWISVGDSHLYLMRGGVLRKLNEDHSYAAMLVKAGTYDANDPELDQYRSVIASAVSGDDIKHIDLPVQPEQLEPGDILLAASDGLDTLNEDHIEALLYEKRETSPQDMSGALIDAVTRVARSSQDNVTVIVVRLEGEAATTAATASVPPVHEAVTRRHNAAEQDEPAAEKPDTASTGAGTPADTPLRERTDTSREPRKNWAFAALVAMAVLGGGIYWTLSMYTDYPGRGPAGIFSSDIRSPARIQARQKQYECVTTSRFGWWRGRSDCEIYMEYPSHSGRGAYYGR